MSQTQVASAVEKSEILVRRFLTQNDLEALPGNGFKTHTFTIDRDDIGRGGRGQIKTVSIDLAFKFWMWQVSRKPYGFF